MRIFVLRRTTRDSFSQ